jgi:hypothetical protein
MRTVCGPSAYTARIRTPKVTAVALARAWRSLEEEADREAWTQRSREAWTPTQCGEALRRSLDGEAWTPTREEKPVKKPGHPQEREAWTPTMARSLDTHKEEAWRKKPGHPPRSLDTHQEAWTPTAQEAWTPTRKKPRRSLDTHKAE